MATQDNKPTFIDNFKRRVRDNKPTRWVRFGIVAVIFLLWVAWMQNWWLALGLILLFDIYITGYIPLTWWKKSNNTVVRYVMSWLDAIVYALILVYFVFSFVGQNYEIPSSSLEKSLLTGDYLVVNKMAYGPRVPMTPIHFPLVQNTFPIIPIKSYLEWPQLKYHRLQGLGKVERGDIVVFNFPAGDTIAFACQNPDYYSLVRILAFNQGISEEKAREYIRNNPAQFGQVMYRPVDRRENYVKRAIGLPGDTLKIVEGVIYINGEAMKQPENVQFNYLVQFNRPLSESEWDDFGVAVDDRHLYDITPENIESFRYLGFDVEPARGGMPTIFDLPLTAAMVASLENNPAVTKIIKRPVMEYEPNLIFPSGLGQNWTRADYGELWIPQKGKAIRLNAYTWDIYGRCIKNYEHNDDAYLNPADGRVYIGGKPADTYTFQMDYYFMMGDNRDNSLDSRYWGFVPEDHIVGRPEMVLVSFDKDKGWLDGKLRTDRIFIKANPDQY